MPSKWVELSPLYKKLPPQISPERLHELVMRLRRDKDKSVEQEIVLGHLRLGFSIVMNRIKRYNIDDVEDYISEMEFAILKAVRRARRGALRDNNITGFIIDYIKKYLNRGEQRRRERAVSIPPRTIRYWNQIGSNKVNRIPVQFSMETNPETYKVDDTNNIVMLRDNISYKGIIPIAKDTRSTLDLEEILDRLPEDKTQKRILELRKHSYTYEEISQVIGLSVSRVGQLLNMMEEKFDIMIKEAK